jgi:acyl-CoA synthetase (NDP forming)
MMKRLNRLFAPRTVVVIGGGTWCENVVRQCRDIGFPGSIWPVHPSKAMIGGLAAYPDLDSLPGIPDAAFVGVNRNLSVEIVARLARIGCGGAVCFAAGFREAVAELADGAELQDRLVAAAADMPVLGPNCYGIVNALDRVALWPDRHGLKPLERGVAVIGQSSNVLINLTMQRRGLPLAVVAAAGNQAQTSMADLGIALLEDPRITALGLHIEGVGDLRAFERLARRAEELDKPIVALRVGISAQAQAAAVSHTASLVGSEAGGRALLARLGIGQVETAIVSASCSGGEASLMADLGAASGVEFPPLNGPQSNALRDALGPKVALANPLDYNTYIWGNPEAMRACFRALALGGQSLSCIVIDYPREDRFAAPDYDVALEAATASRGAGAPAVALVSLLGEGLSEAQAERVLAAGLIPLCGMVEALAAIRVAADIGEARAHARSNGPRAALLVPGSRAQGETTIIGEADAKQLIVQAGIRIPRSDRATMADDAGVRASRIGFPVVLKGEGIAHKTEAGAVVLNLGSAEAVALAARRIPATSFLVEEMITGAVAELLIGITRDPAHGFVLTMGLGGVLTELIRDTVSVLVPSPRDEVRAALLRLRTAPLLTGYRGRAGADLDAVLDTVMAMQAMVAAHAEHLEEIEINPLICRARDAVAADALIRMGMK